MNKSLKYTVKEFPIGFIVPVWRSGLSLSLQRIFIGPSAESFLKEDGNCSEGYHPDIDKLLGSLDLYFSSKVAIKYSPSLLSLEQFSDFAKSVLLTLMDVPFGTVISYGKLAEKAGYPGASRAVGNVMNKNSFPLVIPCHRVIKSNGKIGGFAFGEGMKEYLLKLEQKEDTKNL